MAGRHFLSGQSSRLLRGLIGVCLGAMLPVVSLLMPLSAQPLLVGITRSRSGDSQWDMLINRLQTSKVAYRTIDLQQVKTVNDLAGITVLFLPNVESLTLEQIIVFRDWVSQGGRIVTADRWQNNPTAALDEAWLQQILSQPAELPNPAPSNTVSRPVVPATTPSARIKPPRPRPKTPRSSPSAPAPEGTDPAEQVAPAGIPLGPVSLPITPIEALAMRQELEDLVGRVESALLAAEAYYALQQADSLTPTDSNKTSAPPKEIRRSLPNVSRDSWQTLAQAQQVIRDFPKLVAQQDYATARQLWLQTRNLLWSSYPLDQPLAQPEIRAVWLDRGTIVRAGSEAELAKIFDRLAAAGINTVFVETVNAGYPIYPSQVAPQPNPLTRHWDPLAAAVKLGHARRMEIHAWVWAFAAGHERHNQLLNLPKDYPGPVIAAHPNWANTDNRGKLIPVGQNKPFLDPANPEVRQYLLQLFTEIVTRYNVDGLQLDYIRYPFQDPGANRTYGYGQAARQQFQQLTGVDPTQLTPQAKTPQGQRLWQQWTEFRATQINQFVAEVSQTLHRLRPNLILSAAVFPLSEHDRFHKLQQQWEVWAQKGEVDLLVPMAYAADTNRFQRLVQPWLSPSVLGSTLISPGIYLLNLPETATIDQIQVLRGLPSGGYSLFAAEHLSDRLQQIFVQTQGKPYPIAAAPIPYRQPFAAAAARYDALKQEWDVLIGQQKLRLREPELAQWQAQTQVLQQTLRQLADAPTPQQFARTRQELTHFQSQFPRWTRLQALNQTYQVRSWTNRLAAIETLLRYGERTILPRISANSTPAEPGNVSR